MGLEHGSYSISVLGNVIIMRLKEAFNEEGARILFSEVKEIIDKVDGDKFSIIANFLELDGATPEAFNEADSYNKWLCKKGIIAKAIVINSDVLKNIDIQRIPAQKSLNVEFFSDEKQAFEWLKKQS